MSARNIASNRSGGEGLSCESSTTFRLQAFFGLAQILNASGLDVPYFLLEFAFMALSSPKENCATEPDYVNPHSRASSLYGLATLAQSAAATTAGQHSKNAAENAAATACIVGLHNGADQVGFDLGNDLIENMHRYVAERLPIELAGLERSPKVVEDAL